MKRHWHPPRKTGFLAFGAVVISGCATLNPSADIEHASTLVTSRSGSDTGWTAPWYAAAGAWDGTSPLSSDAAVRVALQNNRAIRREVETIVAFRADLVQAHLLPNPVLSVAFGFPTDGLGGEPLMSALVQELAWLWRRPAAIDAAEADLRRQILGVSDAALRLVAEVRRSHAAVVFAEQTVALQQESAELLERSTQLMGERLAVGEASRLDVNRTELDLHDAATRLADRRATLAAAKRHMLDVLGRAAASADWVTDGHVPALVDEHAALDEERVVQLAQSHRLDVAAADAAVDGRIADVNLQQRGRIPDISAGAGYQKNFSNRPGVFPSINMTPKIFDDGRARIARAESELRQMEIEADRVRQAAITEARVAWVNLHAEQSIVRAYENEIVGLAQSNALLARDAFDAGESDLTVLLEAQRQRNDAVIELTDRRLQAASLQIELERAAGGTLAAPPPVEHVFVTAPRKPPAAKPEASQ